MSETTIVIGIGGHIDGVPMDPQAWRNFQAEVRHVPGILSGTVYFHGEGEGVFEGKSEPSYTVVASLPTINLGTLRAILVALATAYCQQSIALTVGETEFCESVRPS